MGGPLAVRRKLCAFSFRLKIRAEFTAETCGSERRFQREVTSLTAFAEPSGEGYRSLAAWPVPAERRRYSWRSWYVWLPDASTAPA
jgi:hypothetical protein